MLQVEPVTFGDFSVDCLFDPVDVVDHPVAPLLLHHVDSPLELGVDDPDEQEPLALQHWHWDVLDGLVSQTGVLDGHSSRGLRGGESPWGVHHDDVELALCNFQLFGYEQLEVELRDVCADRHCVLPHVGPGT